MSRRGMHRGASIALALALAGAVAGCATQASPPDRQPKYGPLATPLRISHEYIREADAPDYWALSPYYAAQRDDKSCSLASVAMVVNAARARQNLSADDELVTQEALLEKSALWRSCLGLLGRGVTLDQLATLTEEALAPYAAGTVTVSAIHVSPGSTEARDQVHRALVENERGGGDFIIANFIQGAYTGDTGGGHIAPVGGYDAKRRRVLILDVDRRWYEPYWVSEETFVAGMATLDLTSGRARGLVWVKVGR